MEQGNSLAEQGIFIRGSGNLDLGCGIRAFSVTRKTREANAVRLIDGNATTIASAILDIFREGVANQHSSCSALISTLRSRLPKRYVGFYRERGKRGSTVGRQTSKVHPNESQEGFENADALLCSGCLLDGRAYRVG
jgi:hypothetical protein